MVETLRPCPFCGESVAEIEDAKNLEGCPCFDDCDHAEYEQCEMHAVVCDVHKGGCGASSGYFVAVEDAVDAWNRRAEPEEAFVLMVRESVHVPINDFQLAPGEVTRATVDVTEARPVAASSDVHALREAMVTLNVMRCPSIRGWNVVRVPCIGGDHHDR